MGAAEQPSDDTGLAKLAARQHGVVSRHQLLALGFSSQAIKTLVSRGRLHRLHLAVYAVGHTRLKAQGHWTAAVLACGPSAVLSYAEAAALHDLRRVPNGLINVTAPTRHTLPGIRCHFVRTLHQEDTTVIDGIPVTSLARTYLDMAEILTSSRLIDVLEAGERQNTLDARAIEAVIARNPGRRGIRPLQAALAEIADDPPLLQSDPEKAFRHLIRAHGLPEPQYNVYVEGELVDAAWPEHRLVAEVDGWNYHRTKRSFKNDRRRDRKLLRAQWRTARFTADEVTDEPAGPAAELSELLSAGPWPPPAR